MFFFANVLQSDRLIHQCNRPGIFYRDCLTQQQLITVDCHKKLIFLLIIMFFQQILTLSIIQAPAKVTEIGPTSVVEHIRLDFQEFILKTSSLCVFSLQIVRPDVFE